MFDQSRNRFMRGGRVDPTELPKGASGRALCRWCNLEVPKGRRTFCSEWCVDQWRLRTDASYLRERVFQRDRGICSVCGCDTVAEWARIRRLRRPKREMALAGWGVKGTARTSLWDADHIVPVVEGGGECDLDNLRTLCLKCHREATAGLRLRRRKYAETHSETLR